MDWFLYDIGLRHERVNQNNFDKENKTTCLPLLIVFSFLSEISTTLKIGIPIT